MPQNQRPKSISLCKIEKYPASKGIDYGYDVGASHIADWLVVPFIRSSRKPPIESSRIGRYLDGEEEAEGTFR